MLIDRRTLEYHCYIAQMSLGFGGFWDIGGRGIGAVGALVHKMRENWCAK